MAVKLAITSDLDRGVSVLVVWNGSKIVLVSVTGCDNDYRVWNDI